MLQHKELKINSLQSNLIQVERFVEEICDENYISDNYFGNIMLAIEEAVKNAMIHGNRQVVSKQVTLTCVKKKGEICFTIEDEGMGFDPAGIPNPLESEDFKGNGLFLIRSLADKVSFNPSGNKIEISFTISSINQETTIRRISHLKSYFRKQKTFA
jgi:serine/threonine-protein kinase RsbW